MRSRMSLSSVPRIYFPLSRLALCADCEACFEIGLDACPACGGETWSPLSRLIGNASDGAIVRAVRAVVAETSRSRPPVGGRHLVIVSREQPKLYDMLRRDLEDNREVTVVLDRRGRGPQPALPRLPNQRWRNVDRQIAALGWAIVRADGGPARR
jgi:hypothetical protein